MHESETNGSEEFFQSCLRSWILLLLLLRLLALWFRFSVAPCGIHMLYLVRPGSIWCGNKKSHGVPLVLCLQNFYDVIRLA